MIIPPRSYNRQQILAQLQSFITGLPDYARWKDFFDSSVGETLLDLLASIIEFLHYKIDVRTYDAYLRTAITKPAVYLLAQMLGYNPNRRGHAVGAVEFRLPVVASTDITIPQGYQIDYQIPLVVSANTTLTAGTSSVIVPVMQGEWETINFTAAGTEWESFYFGEDFEVDQREVYVSVNSHDLDIIDKIETASPNSVLARTDYKGGVWLLFGDGNYGYRLSAGDDVEVRYLKTLGLNGHIAENTDLGLYTVAGHTFDVVVSTVIQGGSNEDSLEKVKYVASQFFQTQGRAVTAKDYEAVVLSYPGVISASARSLGDYCCTICISAIKEDLNSWTNVEIDALLEYLQPYKMISLKVEFYQPEEVPIDITVDVECDRFLDQAVVTNLINDVLTTYHFYHLGQNFEPEKFVRDIYTELTYEMIQHIKSIKVSSVNGSTCPVEVLIECNQYFVANNVTTNFELVTDL